MKNFGDAVIICGGKSRRMGFDKSLLKIDGEYIINRMASKLCQIFDNVRLCGNGQDKFEIFDLDLVEDIYKGGIGPIAAVHAALSHAKSRYVFVVAVDMPLLNLPHIRYMMALIEDVQKLGKAPAALVPINGLHKEAIYAFYSTETLSVFEEEITGGRYAMHKILTKFDTMYLDEEISRNFDMDLAMFTNLNYACDLSKLEGKK